MLTAHIRIAGVDLQFTAWQIDRLGGADIKLLLRQLDKGQTAEIHRANDLGGAGARAAIAWRCASEVVDHLHFREGRSEEHTSELQSLMRISYAVFCLKKKKKP